MHNIISPITDADIDAIEKVMGSDLHFDENRRQIIKAITEDSVKDVQAFPGTGKTTLLIAKLGILSKKWCNKHGGLCVLSFTNAASDEVNQRLGRTTYGASLMNYPHYIGTIHSFLATYVVEPWFQSRGTHINTIDTDIVTSRRWKGLTEITQDVLTALDLSQYSLQKGEFESVSEVINNKSKWHTHKWNRKSACEILGRTPKCLDERSASGLGIQQQLMDTLKQVINVSIWKGELTFDEIIHFAKKAVSERPEIAMIVSNRFPMLFIDEAQDTSPAEYECLRLLFANSVVQTFGDKNQSIFNAFGNDDSVELPREGSFQLTDSKRLSPSLVKLVTPLANEGSTMVGCNNRFPQAHHTIILFEKGQADRVLPCFGNLILQTFSDKEIRENHACYAVGLINKIKPSDVDTSFPRAVNSYYSNYIPAQVKPEKVKYEHLIDYQRSAREILTRGGNTGQALHMFLAGVQRLLEATDLQLFRPGLGSPLNKIGKLLGHEDLLNFRKSMQAMMQTDYEFEVGWQFGVFLLKRTISKIEGYMAPDGYYDWTTTSIKLSQKANVPKNNVNCLNFEEDGRSVRIQLGSIHSVKGQTHLATLVLETKYYEHVLHALLPCLEGKQSVATLNKRGRYTFVPTTYVGLTRAEGLACLAIPNDEVSMMDLLALKQIGWNIISVTKSEKD